MIALAPGLEQEWILQRVDPQGVGDRDLWVGEYVGVSLRHERRKQSSRTDLAGLSGSLASSVGKEMSDVFRAVAETEEVTPAYFCTRHEETANIPQP